jgi:hypothetical protein
MKRKRIFAAAVRKHRKTPNNRAQSREDGYSEQHSEIQDPRREVAVNSADSESCSTASPKPLERVYLPETMLHI